MDAMDAIAAKRYIEPTDGQSFANQLYAAITIIEGQNLSLTIQLQKAFLTARHNGQGGDIFMLCNDVTEMIVMEHVAIPAMKIARTIPLLTNLNHSIVAASFGDSAAVQQLERKRERC